MASARLRTDRRALDHSLRAPARPGLVLRSLGALWRWPGSRLPDPDCRDSRDRPLSYGRPAANSERRALRSDLGDLRPLVLVAAGSSPGRRRAARFALESADAVGAEPARRAVRLVALHGERWRAARSAGRSLARLDAALGRAAVPRYSAAPPGADTDRH